MTCTTWSWDSAAAASPVRPPLGCCVPAGRQGGDRSPHDAVGGRLVTLRQPPSLDVHYCWRHSVQTDAV